MSLNPVQKWLQSILGPYRYRDEVYADVDRTLQAVPSLSPRTDTYTYDDGRTVLLLTLQGTIPIAFRGSSYNIPVAYWIPHAYPREAPIAYVVPASNMLVRQSANVDLSGLIKADFLQAWSRKWEGNNLLLLTETLQSIFSREPPLYAKPAQQNGHPPPSPIAGPSQPSRQASGPRPPPAPPVQTSSHMTEQSPRSPTAYNDRQGTLSPSQVHTPQGQAGPPGRPQKPWLNGQPAPLSPIGQHHRSASTSSTRHLQPSVYSPHNGQTSQQPQEPPRPPVPHVYEHHRSASAGQPTPPTPFRQPSLHIQPGSSYESRSPPPQQQVYNAQSTQQPQSFYPPQSPKSPQPAQAVYRQDKQPHPNYQQGYQSIANPQQQLQPPSRQQQYQPQPNRLASSSSAQSLQPQTTESSAPYIPPRPDQYRNTASPGTSRTSRHQRLATPVNILDEDDDPSHASSSSSAALPPPPRPTNPALLNLRRALYAQLAHYLHTLQAHLNSENDHLKALHTDLLKGEPAILDEMQRLEAVRDVCLSVKDRMNNVVETAQRNIEDLSTRPETEVDELICGTNVVHNQLLDLVAEDNALEDAIYHLSRYFNSDTRSQEELERFLKRTRILAREQFMKRAHINKILLDIALSRAQRS